MNCNKFICGVAILCAIAFLFASCQKEALDTANHPKENSSNFKLSGAVPDDPALVAKVPMITSADFMADKISNYFSTQPLTESAKAGGTTSGRDRTTPTVNIITPSTGSTVSNTVTVQVTATDNVGVTAVILKVDGLVIGTGNIAPYNFNWNTAGLSNGTHTLTATATDAAGNSKVSTVQVGYNTAAGADITPPSVIITSPTNGAAVSSTVTVAVTASDNIGVTSVTFKVDDVLVGTDNSAPYSFSWNTSTLASGIHNLSAAATDGAGNSNANSLQVTVNTVVIPPTGSLPADALLLMPPVAVQGGEGCCVAFSVGYAARSAEQFYKTNASAYDQATNVFSPEFLYNQTKLSDCASGVGVATALNFLMSTGISSWAVMPYSSYNGCSLMPTADQLAQAANYKISGFSRVPVADITAIKTMIVNKHPLVITFAIDQSFSQAHPGFVWRSYSGAPGVSHSVAICGYDDSKHAYKIMNSWGTTWGDAGYSWIDYDFLPQAAYYYAYVID